jgi:hypothetical protein
LGEMCCEDGSKMDFPERVEVVRRQRIPCKETVVCAVFHDIFLKPGEGLFSFSESGTSSRYA